SAYLKDLSGHAACASSSALCHVQNRKNSDYQHLCAFDALGSSCFAPGTPRVEVSQCSGHRLTRGAAKPAQSVRNSSAEGPQSGTHAHHGELADAFLRWRSSSPQPECHLYLLETARDRAACEVRPT